MQSWLRLDRLLLWRSDAGGTSGLHATTEQSIAVHSDEWREEDQIVADEAVRNRQPRWTQNIMMAMEIRFTILLKTDFTTSMANINRIHDTPS